MNNDGRKSGGIISTRLRYIGLSCLALGGGVFAARAAVARTPVAVLACILPALVGGGLFLIGNPMLLYWLLVLSSPFNDHLGVSAGGVNMRPYNILASSGLAFVLIFYVFRIHSDIVARARECLVLFIPLILMAFSKLTTQVVLTDFPGGMTRIFPAKYSIFYILLFLTCFVVSVYAGKREVVYKSIGYWIHLTNIIIFIAIIQLILSNVAGYHFVHHRDVISIGRPYSVFREPDVLGSFVGATLLIIVPLLIAEVNILPRWYLRVSLYLNALMVVILFVRAAWLGVLASLVIWIVCMLKTERIKESFAFFNKVVLLGITGLLLLLILVPSFSDKLLSRFGSLTKPQGESASEYRLRELDTMFIKSLPKDLSPTSLRTFLFGHGDFAWSYWAPKLLGEKYDRAAVEAAQKSGTVLIHAGFNMALTIFFDNGLVGFSLLLLFFIILILKFIKVYFNCDGDEDKAVLLSLFLPVICILICFQFSYDPISPFFWVLIGLFVAMGQIIAGKDGYSIERSTDG